MDQMELQLKIQFAKSFRRLHHHQPLLLLIIAFSVLNSIGSFQTPWYTSVTTVY